MEEVDLHTESVYTGDMKITFNFNRSFQYGDNKAYEKLSSAEYSGNERITNVHNHSWGELHCVCSGHLRFYVGESVYDVYAGELFYIPPDIFHETLYCTDDTQHYALGILCYHRKCKGESLYSSFFTATSGCCRKLSDRALYDALLSFRWLWLTVRPGMSDRIKAWLTVIAFGLYDNLSGGSARYSVTDTRTVDIVNSRIETVDGYLQANLANDISVKDMEKLLYLSSRQINRFFRENYRTTFREKLNSLRMEEAKRLLRTSNMNASEIASAVGFGSLPGFYRAFGRYSGCTPLAYRRSGRH